jgi:hypothetical protein
MWENVSPRCQFYVSFYFPLRCIRVPPIRVFDWVSCLVGFFWVVSGFVLGFLCILFVYLEALFGAFLFITLIKKKKKLCVFLHVYGEKKLIIFFS